jgi:O-acetyl-ADP-ribose deacetylase (regulator of RNase III)
MTQVKTDSSIEENTFSVLSGNIINLASIAADQHKKNVVLVHGCNCQHAMGALAGEIAHYFPQAEKADFMTPVNDRKKLGSYSQAEAITAKGNKWIIVNAYTQYNGGRVANTSELEETIAKVFHQIAKDFPPNQTIIYYPQIGAGVAGGNWAAIHPRIKKALSDHEQVLVEFDGTAVKSQLLTAPL